jgi:hypothetical protein
MNSFAGVVGVAAYALAFGMAIYERAPINGWLMSLLPL